MFKEVGVNRSAESCNPKLRLKHVNSSASMAPQTVPPYLNWDREESNHGPVFSVESVALCCVSYLSLFHPLFFSSPQTGFCYPVHNAGTFCVMYRYRRWLSAAFYGGLSENIVQQVLFSVFSPKAAIYSLFKRRIVCLFFSDRTVKEMCIFVLNCNLCFKMLMGYLSHDLMSLW